MTVTEPTTEPSTDELERLAGAVDDALAALDDLDPESAAAARRVKDAIEALHRPALVHVVRTLRADPRGKELLFELVDEPTVRAVLGLHGIVRADPATRARQALESVRPYLQSHGGDVELVAIADGVAQVRLHGSCTGCSMSAVTLRDGVESALVDGVEEVERIEVLDDEPTAAFIPLDLVGRKAASDHGWVRGPAVEQVGDGTMVRADVGDESFVVTNIGQRIAAFRNACVHQGLTLDGGLLSEGVITCPWHGLTFDATTGECISAPGAQLEQLPTRVDDGHVWIRTAGR